MAGSAKRRPLRATTRSRLPTSGPAPAKPLSRDDQQKPEPRPSGKPAPGAANKADIDEIIKNLKLKDAELEKLNKAEIDALRKRIEEELKKKAVPTKP